MRVRFDSSSQFSKLKQILTGHVRVISHAFLSGDVAGSLSINTRAPSLYRSLDLFSPAVPVLLSSS